MQEGDGKEMDVAEEDGFRDANEDEELFADEDVFADTHDEQHFEEEATSAATATRGDWQ